MTHKIRIFMLLPSILPLMATTCEEEPPVNHITIRISNHTSGDIYVYATTDRHELTSYVAFQTSWNRNLTEIGAYKTYDYTLYEPADRDNATVQVAVFRQSTIEEYGIEKIVDLNIMDRYYRFTATGKEDETFTIIYKGESSDE